jgi:hypothetical protein
MLSELIGIVSSSKSLDIVQSSLDFFINDILGKEKSRLLTKDSIIKFESFIDVDGGEDGDCDIDHLKGP